MDDLRKRQVADSRQPAGACRPLGKVEAVQDCVRNKRLREQQQTLEHGNLTAHLQQRLNTKHFHAALLRVFTEPGVVGREWALRLRFYVTWASSCALRNSTYVRFAGAACGWSTMTQTPTAQLPSDLTQALQSICWSLEQELATNLRCLCDYALCHISCLTMMACKWLSTI